MMIDLTGENIHAAVNGGLSCGAMRGILNFYISTNPASKPQGIVFYFSFGILFHLITII